MATIEPNNRLRLLKCPLTINNKHQLTFQNEPEQYNYFDKLPNLRIDQITYQRKNSTIRYPAHIDDLINYNYCMYQNFNFGSKWFYAFIVGMKFINPEMTEIQIVTDVFQTWQFDLNWKPSFIEREMIMDDSVGANLIPESLEIGEAVAVESNFGQLPLNPIYIIAFADDKITFENKTINFASNVMNGIPNSVFFLLTNDLPFLIEYINGQGNGDKIITAFTIPKFAVQDFIDYCWNDTTGTAPIYKLGSSYAIGLNEDFKQNLTSITFDGNPYTLKNYTPKNNKLFTYPYNFLALHFNGNNKLYRFEDFNSNSITFNLISEINPNPTVFCMPLNYKGYDNSWSVGGTEPYRYDNINAFIFNGYPTLSSKNDYFNTWLAQNSSLVNLNLQSLNTNNFYDNLQNNTKLLGNIFNAAISGINSINGINNSKDNYSLINSAIGSFSDFGNNIVNAGQTALSSQRLNKNYEINISQLMAQVEKQQLLPDNINLGDNGATPLGYNLFGFSFFTHYSIKPQFAKLIDDYFSMYGYATNQLKIPNIKTRPNWNYVKTAGANILANIPQEDLEFIKSLFDNGITLWHNPNTFMDYTQNNK